MANLINGHGKGFNVYGDTAWHVVGPCIQWDTRGSNSKGIYGVGMKPLWVAEIDTCATASENAQHRGRLMFWQTTEP